MKKIKVGQLGVNYVETIINKNGCSFTKIDQENDIGLDGYIEICQDGKSTLVAVQIKCGESYYQSKKQYCKLPIGNHFEYWKNYKLPVYGIICNRDLTNAYFVNIKLYLDDVDNEEQNYIMFEKSEFLKFDNEHFFNYFCNIVNRKVPVLTLDESLFYINSNFYNDQEIAFCNLSSRHVMRRESWVKFLELLRNKSFDVNRLIYTFSRIFGNPDSIPVDLKDEDRLYLIKFLDNLLNEEEVVNLLSCIDEENGIARGTVGQCVETILNSINKSEILLKIINNFSYDDHIRECAVLIFAYRNAKKYVKLYREQLIMKTEFNEMILDQIKKYGGIDLY